MGGPFWGDWYRLNGWMDALKNLLLGPSSTKKQLVLQISISKLANLNLHSVFYHHHREIINTQYL